jgi:hypothetical protein
VLPANPCSQVDVLPSLDFVSGWRITFFDEHLSRLGSAVTGAARFMRSVGQAAGEWRLSPRVASALPAVHRTPRQLRRRRQQRSARGRSASQGRPTVRSTRGGVCPQRGPGTRTSSRPDTHCLDVPETRRSSYGCSLRVVDTDSCPYPTCGRPRGSGREAEPARGSRISPYDLISLRT